MGSSKKTDTINQTQTRSPWAPAQPLLQQSIDGLQSWMGSDAANSVYEGPRVAGPSQYTTRGLDVLSGGAGARAATDYNTRVLNGDYLNAGNPYMSALQDSIKAQVMPGVNSTFSGAGLVGSSLHQGMLAKALTQGMAAPMAQLYDAERNRQTTAAAAMPGLDNLRADQLLRAGGITEGFDQRNLDAQKQLWEEQRLAPIRGISDAFPMVNTLGNMGGTTTVNGSTTTGNKTPLWQSVLGGGMMGAQLLAAPFGGATIGAGIGKSIFGV